jgi:hypothetical protein
MGPENERRFPLSSTREDGPSTLSCLEFLFPFHTLFPKVREFFSFTSASI